MNKEINFMNFENLNRLIEEHKKETHPYKKYEFDSTSYTLLLIDINNLAKENKTLKENAENNGKVVDRVNWENQLLKKENKKLKDNWSELKEDISYILEMIEHNKDVIKVTSDEELAIYSLQNKMQELEQGSDSNE